MPNPLSSAQAIIFAINSAIKLGRNVQHAYIKSIKSREIVLPLPKFDGSVDVQTANDFFKKKQNPKATKDGFQFIGRIEGLDFLHKKFDTGFDTVKEDEAYIEYYKKFSSLLKAEVGSVNDTYVNTDDLISLLTIRQWEAGKQGSTPLQIIAGTIVEIGIAYFNQVPGALNKGSTFGKVMTRVLHALDDVEFHDKKKLHEFSKLILPRLFITAAEVVADLSTEISSDEKVQKFIQATSLGIANDLMPILEAIDKDNSKNAREKHKSKKDAVVWGQMLMRSMVKNSGTYVFNAPGDIFDTNEGGTALIKATGGVLMDILLNDPDKINIKAGFNVESLDRLVVATLEVVAEFPMLATKSKEEGVRNIIGGVSKSIAKSGIQRPDLVPELVRLIFANTAENFDLLWQANEPGGEQILLIAVKELITVISTPIEGETWEPHLSKAQIISIAENILDEVVNNPEWVRGDDDKPSVLRQVLDAVFGALSKIPKDQRLNAAVLDHLLKISLRAAATSQQVLNSIEWADDGTEKVILNKALDLVFTYVFESEFVDPANRTELLVNLLDYIMEVIIIYHPDERGLMLIDLILFESPNVDYTGGFDEELADQLIEAALAVLSEHPELATNHKALQAILSGVAGALDATDFRQKDFLPELVRLTMEYSALNAGLILDADTDEPRYLLVLALEQLLSALSRKPKDGEWSPQLGTEEIMTIIENVFDELLLHPEWVASQEGEHTLFGEVVAAVFEALLQIPHEQRLNSETIEYLIQLSLRTTVNSPEVLKGIKWASDAEESTILNKALDLVFVHIFESGEKNGADKVELLEELLEYIMEVIIAYHPNERGLILIDLILFKDPSIDYSDGFDEELANALIEAALGVLYEHPELVSDHLAIQKIVSGLADGLDASSFKQPGFLPELLRLTLENMATNAQFIVGAEAGEPKYLLVIAMEQLLGKLSYKPDNEAWTPQLTASEALWIIDNLVGEIVEHPEWLIAPENKDSTFSAVVDIVFLTLAKAPEGQRFSAETLEWVLRNSIRIAATHEAVLSTIHWGTKQEETIVLNMVLDMVFSYTFAPNEGEGQVDRTELFVELIAYVFDVILEQHPGKRGLMLVHLILFEDEKLDLTRKLDDEQADILIGSALAALESHPELLIKDGVYQKILKDTASALKSTKWTNHDILPELFRLVLVNIANNIDQVMDFKVTGPKHLLATAIEETLRAISVKPKRGKWRPRLGDTQALEIIDTVLEEVIRNPQWVGKDKIITTVFEAIHLALDTLPKGQSLPYEVYSAMIIHCFEAVAFRKQLAISFIDTDGNTKTLALTYSLQGLFVEIYGEDGSSAASWTLSQTDVFTSIIEHYLKRIAEGAINQEEIDGSLGIIQEAAGNLNDNLAFTVEELLEELAGSA